MGATYFPIASQTLTSGVDSITFSNIPNTYTDLVFTMSSATSYTMDIWVEFNGDTSYSYSWLYMVGAPWTGFYNYANFNASSAIGGYIYSYNNSCMNIMSYANTSMHKPIIVSAAANSLVYRTTSVWRSTSAISSVKFYLQPGYTTFAAGSSFSLYGIKAA